MHSVRVYSIRVRAPRTKDLTPLANINGLDLFDIINQALEALANSPATSIEGRTKKAYELTGLAIDGRYISGWIESGHYGYKSRIKNVEDNTTTHEKSRDEVELVPLFFIFHIGHDGHGFAVLHKFGQAGIKSFLYSRILEAFVQKIKTHVLHMTPVLDESALDAYLTEGQVKRVRFLKYTASDDIADVATGLGSEEEAGEVEIHIKPRRGSTLANAKDEIRRYLGNNPSGVLTSLEDEAPEIKVDLDMGEKSRTISLKNPKDINMDILLEGQVAIGLDGHPETESIIFFSKELIGEQYAKLAGA